MPLTNAERQRTRRERHRGEPRGNKPLLAQLAALQARVAQLEVDWRLGHSRRQRGHRTMSRRCGGNGMTWLNGWRGSMRISQGSRRRRGHGLRRLTGHRDGGSVDADCRIVEYPDIHRTG
jgi:hypothetical protein